jgi:hypothetical protein
MVAMTIEVKLKKLKRKKTQKKWNLDILKENEETLRLMIDEKITQKKKEKITVEERWKKIKDSITTSCTEILGHKTKKATKKPWITSGMLDKMDERRKWKNINTDEGRSKYRKLNNELRRETEKAREEWWKTECEELELLDRKGRSDLMYDKVRRLSKQNTGACSKANAINSIDGNLLTDPADIRNRWKEYIELLYDKENKPKEEELSIEEENIVGEDYKGPDISESEVIAAIREMKNNKAVGVDGIPAEILKTLGEDTLKEIVKLCKDMYRDGKWPKDFTRSIVIPIPKKPNAINCADYRTISLISHAAKIMLKVITRRLEGKANEYIGRNQFGFKRGCGTREAIAVMKILAERCLENGQDLYICFVDFEKAFDRVNWVEMMKVLKKMGVDWRDRRMIKNLYMKQETIVRIDGEESEAGVIGRGNRQGCPLSPLLFSAYAETMMAEAMESIQEGINVGGELLKDVRFADDQGMVASSEEGLQTLMNGLTATAKRYDMKINAKKTKAMIISKTDRKEVNIKIDGEKVEQVHSFKYLGAHITDDGRNTKEIRIRIGMAKVAFNKRKELLSRKINRELKKKIIKTTIWPIALYACETWSLLKVDMNRLSAFEMWLWRRMEKISWTEKKTNEEVLKTVGEQKHLVQLITERKKKWLGHILRERHGGLLKDVMEGKLEGKRVRGRPRLGMLHELMEGGTYEQMKRMAEDRDRWRHWAPRTCQQTENS